MVCITDKNREGRKAGRIGTENGSGEFVWGMLCDLPGTAVEKVEAKFCSNKESFSRICVYYFQ